MSRDVEELFHAARSRGAAERLEFLRAACGDDLETLSAVQSLLRSSETSDDFLETPAAEWFSPASSAPFPAAPGSRIGNYRLIRQIAAGGMGIVYEAVQDAPRRTVALKLLRRGFRCEAAIRRFGRESEVLGRLSHAGVARIYEAGVQDEAGESLPFFAMEMLSDALPLTAYANSRAMDTRQRIELFCKACDAVHYCHEQGVVHRDLKPANLLVTPEGQPKIIDFGIAHLQSGTDGSATWHTTGAPLIGSLGYMSPEQISGEAGAVDRQTDVYALGVIAYELIAGRSPHDLADRPPLEAARIIREEDPAPLETVDRALGEDLQTIVATAMAKEKQRRYPSAEALAQDCRRFLRAQPIHARPPSRWYLIALFARRHRALCALGATSAVMLLVATAVSVFFALRAERQRGVARRAEALALTEREAADYQAYIANIAAADAALRIHDVAEASRRLDRAPQRFRNWEWRYLRARLDLSRQTFKGHEGVVDAVAFSPDGQCLATGTGGWGYNDPIIRIWDVSTGALLQELEGHTAGVGAVAFHPRDASLLASGSNDDTVRLWDLRRGETAAVLPHRRNVGHAFFASDGAALITVDDTGMIYLWDMHSATLQRTLGDPSRRECHCATLLPARMAVVCGGWDGVVRAIDLTTDDTIAALRGHTASVIGVAVSPDGALIASASEDSTIRVWRADEWVEFLTLRGHTAAVIRVAFAPGPQRHLASISLDNTVRLWRLGDPQEPPSSEPLAVLHGHAAFPDSLSFSPDGSLLATGASDGTAKLWGVSQTGQPRLLPGHEQMVRTMACSPDGRWIASGAFDHTIRIWNIESGTVAATLDSETERVQTVVFHPREPVLGAACGDGAVRFWNTRTWEQVATLSAEDCGGPALAYSPDGRTVACGSKQGVVRAWDARTRELRHTWRLSPASIETLAFHPRDSALLLVGGTDGLLYALDAGTGRELRRIDSGAKGVTTIAVSNDGTIVASAHLDGTVRLWDVDTEAELHRLIGHTALVNAVAFSPDGTRLVSAGNDATVRLWDAATGEGLTTLRSHEHWVLDVEFSPDGNRIVSGGGSYDGSDCTIRVWEAPRPIP